MYKVLPVLGGILVLLCGCVSFTEIRPKGVPAFPQTGKKPTVYIKAASALYNASDSFQTIPKRYEYPADDRLSVATAKAFDVSGLFASVSTLDRNADVEVYLYFLTTSNLDTPTFFLNALTLFIFPIHMKQDREYFAHIVFKKTGGNQDATINESLETYWSAATLPIWVLLRGTQTGGKELTITQNLNNDLVASVYKMWEENNKIAALPQTEGKKL